MRDNIFADVFEDPFATGEEWIPLSCDNTNSAPGDDVASIAAYRGICAAATIFTIRHVAVRRDVTIETPIASGDFDASGRVSLAGRVRNWFPTAPV